MILVVSSVAMSLEDFLVLAYLCIQQRIMKMNACEDAVRILNAYRVPSPMCTLYLLSPYFQMPSKRRMWRPDTLLRGFLGLRWQAQPKGVSMASNQPLRVTRRSLKVHGVFCQASISWRIKWCDCGKRSVQFSGQENSKSFSLGSQRI